MAAKGGTCIPDILEVDGLCKSFGGVKALRGHVDHWLIAPLAGERALPATALEEYLRRADVDATVTVCTNIAAACDRAYQMAGDSDRILAFGSFLTVAAAMTAIRHRRV